MPINDMGGLNEGWGICGFTSSLYALYEHNPTERSRLAKGGRTSTQMLAEIKSYLTMLQADNATALLNGIQAFTRSFGGGFAAFTPQGYIDMVNEIPKSGKDPDVTDAKYGIAMPPDAVVDYLHRMCELTKSRLEPLDSTKDELILGVCGTDLVMYGGLEHYLYSKGGTIYSWGDQFSSVEAAAKAVKATWTVGYKISIG